MVSLRTSRLVLLFIFLNKLLIEWNQNVFLNKEKARCKMFSVNCSIADGGMYW